MERLEGKRILITGPAGQIAFPLAAQLARDNEVWGIARFSEPGSRERVEAAGIRTQAVDLVAPDWSKLPEEFDYLLHLAAFIGPGHDFEAALRINAEGSGKLMSRFRGARACLLMSSCAVYASPPDGRHAVQEEDPLGGSPQSYAPTYCVSKMGQEAVARFAAEEYGLPTVLARMNVAYGDNGGLPDAYLQAILADQPIPVQPGRASICSLIHEEDIFAHTAGLLAGASLPATAANWGGDEPVEIRELCGYMATLVGREARFLESPEGIHHYRLDPARRNQLAGPCRVPWREGIRRMVAARHPELTLSEG